MTYPVHVCAGVLEQLVVGVEDDDGDLTVAEHGQLVGFLHQTKLALGERDLPVREGDNSSKYSLSQYILLYFYLILQRCYFSIE